MTDRWGEVAGQYLTSQWHSNEEALQKLIGIVQPEGGLILDVGTGAGHTAFAFAPFVDGVVAYDSSQGMLNVAMQEAERRGIKNFETKLGDAHDLPFADGTFNGIVTRCAAHHFKNPRTFLSEAFRSLKPGGWFLLVDTVGIEEPDDDEILDTIERLRDPTHVRNLTIETWLQLAAEAGFEREKIETHAKPLNLKEWLDRQNTPPAERARVEQLIAQATGSLKEYLNPFGTGDDRVFHLREAAILFRKP